MRRKHQLWFVTAVISFVHFPGFLMSISCRSQEPNADHVVELSLPKYGRFDVATWQHSEHHQCLRTTTLGIMVIEQPKFCGANIESCC